MSLLAENRRTLALAVPIMCGHVGQMLMGVVDTVMVGRVGVVPLGACAFANTLLSVPFVFGFGVLSAVSVKVSHAHGSGENEASAAAVRGGFLVALLLALPFAVLAHALLPFVGIFGQPEAVNAALPGYFLLCAWSLVPVFISVVAKSFSEAHGSPWPPFWIMLGGVLLNALMNWIFIFGKLGLPALGLEGAGLATLLARIATAVGIVAWPVLSRRHRAAWPRRWFGCSFAAPARELLRIGLPAGGLHLCEVSGFAAGSIMMGWIGVVALAAHQIAITCAATIFMVPLGFSQALCVRVGQARGAGRISSLKPVVYGGLMLVLAVMCVSATAFVFLGRTITAVFTSDLEVAALAGHLLLLAGAFQFFDGVQVASAGVLRGFEDTRVPMLIGILSYWVIALPVSYAVAFHFRAGAVGVWVGFVIGLAAAAALLFFRMQGRIKLADCSKADRLA